MIIKSVGLALFCLAMALIQAMAANAHTYDPARVAGFFLGFLHGILMPAALPGLVMGNDLPVYASNNAGRSSFQPLVSISLRTSEKPFE